MNADTFDPMADAQANYAHALAMMRLRALMTADRWATEHDTFDLHAAADLARLADRLRERVTG
jgi:hypothetical protein